MLKIKKFIPIAIILLFLLACSKKKQAKTRIQTQLEELDTLVLNTKLSGLGIDRYRVFNHKNEMLKVGKMGFKLDISDLNIHSHATYKIDNGYLVFNKKTFLAACYIKTSQVVMPVIDENKQLKIGTPGYLNKKSSTIVFEFKGNFFPPDREPTTAIFLTIADSTGLITEDQSKIKTSYAKKNKSIKLIDAKFTLNGFDWKLFEPENKNEIEKDSIAGNLKLIFL